MNLTWSNKVIKYVLFVFNFLFVIAGIIMIAVGVSVKTYYTDYDIFLSDSYFSLPNLLIAIGSLSFFISFFGCCGAMKESWFMIFIFSILLALIFIMEFSAGIAGYVLRDQTSSFLTDELTASMKNYNKKGQEPTTSMWDTIQSTFQCCGANDASDWPKVLPSKASKAIRSISANGDGDEGTDENDTLSSSTTQSSTTPTSSSGTTTPTTPTTEPRIDPPVTEPQDHAFDLPASCCKSRTGTTGNLICNYKDNTTATYYKKGCVEGFGDYLKGHAVTLGGVGIAIAFIQLFGVIFACHLTKQLKHGFYST